MEGIYSGILWQGKGKPSTWDGLERPNTHDHPKIDDSNTFCSSYSTQLWDLLFLEICTRHFVVSVLHHCVICHLSYKSYKRVVSWFDPKWLSNIGNVRNAINLFLERRGSSSCLFSCSGQLNRWPCQSVSESVRLLILATSEHCRATVTL